MSEAGEARVLRELRSPYAFWPTGATYCLALCGGHHFRLQTLVCQQEPDIVQTTVFRCDPGGWPLDWGRFLTLNGMDREQALAELDRRVEAARSRAQREEAA